MEHACKDCENLMYSFLYSIFAKKHGQKHGFRGFTAFCTAFPEFKLGQKAVTQSDMKKQHEAEPHKKTPENIAGAGKTNPCNVQSSKQSL